MSDQTTPPAAEGNEAQAVNYDVKVEDSGTLKKKLTVTVPADRIVKKRDEMFGELGQNAQIPGFRVGHAPRRLIEKRFGKEVADDVRNALVGEALGAALEKSELKTLGEPGLDLEKIELPEQGDMMFSFEVEVMPPFELPKLEGIAVKKPVLEMTDQRINESVEQLRESRARYEQTDQPAREGDVVLAGAKIAGQGLAELDRPGLTLRVAPGQIEGLPLVDLGKELAGNSAGQTVTIKIKGPESHPNEAWRGKDLAVAVSISQVRRRVLAEVNEEFAAAMGFGSLSELRDQIRQRMTQRIELEVRQAMRDQVRQYLLENTPMELPAQAAARHTLAVLRRRLLELLQRGVPRERIDENLTQLQAAAAEQAQRDMKLAFILNKVAEQYEITVDEGEVNARIAQMAGEYDRRPERLRQELATDGSLGVLEDVLREEKALEKLLEQAVVTEVTPEQAAEKAPPKAKKKAARKKAPKADQGQQAKK
jgi:trigger factor